MKNIILIAIFALLVVVIAIPLAAQIHFDAAQRFAAKYLWVNADREFKKAVEIDQFDSRYPAGYADFLMMRNKYQDRKIPDFLKAEQLYIKAAKLNPPHAEYYLGAGQTELGLFLSDQNIYSGNLSAGLNNFKKALERDPNGFNISYSAGYSCLSVWKFLKPEEKEWILERLRCSLKIRYWYSKHIYPRLWNVTKDPELLRKITPPGSKAEKSLANFLKKTEKAGASAR